MTSPDIVIIGAGAFGLATAAELKLAGHAVTVVAPDTPSASAVAAGMIAPAMEAAIDGLPVHVGDMLKMSRMLWDVFATRTGIDLQEMPAEWRGEGAERLMLQMQRHDFAHSYDAASQTLLTHEDAKLDPVAALEVMGEGVTRINATAEAIFREGDDWLVVTSEGVVSAPKLVLATGAAAAIVGLPDAVTRIIDSIVPIRGLIGITRERLSDHVLRGEGAYVAPVNAGPFAGGSVIGASMEAGVRDLEPDMECCEAMLAAAWALLGEEPRPIELEWRAGVRGASPDGLPLVGEVGNGLYVALAPRRNGWLLAPLVANQLRAEIEGQSVTERTLDPHRVLNPSDRSGFRP
ncbi:FAD-dependent oxidoreductase [Brevundimonas terrae]|uniref:FAD-dependent oxidoreductase n=1 Tax=Brevundimonas terrae TaxID=363631 RepID=A0ABN0YH87_9CAUL|nr:FAD-binding oxidoreductase [Brevundimonas terrae]NIJ27241.1 glycine oxidase [Brevundimonas terrae]